MKKQHRVADVYLTYTGKYCDENNTKNSPGKQKPDLKIH